MDFQAWPIAFILTLRHIEFLLILNSINSSLWYNLVLRLIIEAVHFVVRLQNKVKKFRLGRGEVIEGLDLAVSTMRKGELARFLIKSEYAYLEMGVTPRIPENCTSKMEITLFELVYSVCLIL